MAILSLIVCLLFFSQWLFIPFLAKLGHNINITISNGLFSLPQTFIALFSSVDSYIATINNFLDLLDVSDKNGDALRQFQSVVRSVTGLLGINFNAGINVDDVVSTIKSFLPSEEKILAVKELLSQISGIVKGVSLSALIFSLVIVAANLYTIIYCFVKKQVNKLCSIGFFIEGIFALIFIMGCYVVNTVVHSKIIFINSVMEPTF